MREACAWNKVIAMRSCMSSNEDRQSLQASLYLQIQSLQTQLRVRGFDNIWNRRWGYPPFFEANKFFLAILILYSKISADQFPDFAADTYVLLERFEATKPKMGNNSLSPTQSKIKGASCFWRWPLTVWRDCAVCSYLSELDLCRKWLNLLDGKCVILRWSYGRHWCWLSKVIT